MTSAKLRINRKLTTSIVVTALAAAIAYLGFSLWAGWREVAIASVAVGWVGFAAALSLALTNYALRFVRWQVYLRALGHPLESLTSGAIYLSGFALTATPGKAGELLRGIFLQERGVPFVSATAALLSERLSDLTGVGLLTLPGIAESSRARPVIVTGILAVVLVLFALAQQSALALLAVWMENHDWRMLRKARHFVYLLIEASRCHVPAILAVATCLSLAAWSCEAFAFYFVLVRMGIHVDLWYVMFVYALAVLAGALSFLPGGLGSTEAVMIALLLLKGVPEPKVVAATIIIRLVTLWFAVALGTSITILGRGTLLPSAEDSLR